jgi:cytochrome c biogenesis protein CcmG/thiol:disulfide interchange protein DsbE
MKRTVIIVVGVALIGFFGYVAYKGMQRDPRILDSALIGKPAADFKLAVLDKPGETFSPADMKGQVWMLNVWATWCEACKDEHPLLVAYSQTPDAAPVIGLDHKELTGDYRMNPEQLSRITPEQENILSQQRSSTFLSQHGNPYSMVAMDLDGRVGLDYGLTGVPETYVIDKQGVIRYKETGIITPEKLKNTIMPLIQKLQSES